MHWIVTHQYDSRGAKLADRHYSRQKPGAKKYTPPGRKLILINEEGTAVWATSWPYAEYVHRVYPDAWVCTLFRNESAIPSSELIREAIAITRWKYGEPPPSGMITMVAPAKVKSSNPGYCYKMVGFKSAGKTKRKGLLILQLPPEAMPGPAIPIGAITWT